MASSPGTPTSVRVLKNVDVIALALALVVFVVAGLPIVGWITGAGAWALQRAISEYVMRRAQKTSEIRTRVGLLAASMIGRGWLVAGILVAVGLNDHKAGLSAAVLFLAVFTLQFTMTMVMRPFETPGEKNEAPR